MSLPDIGRGFVLWASIVLVVAASFGAAGPAQAQTPGAIAGVMTRWQTSTAIACKKTFNGYANQPTCPRASMFSITPDFDGLTLYQWVNTLASAGVNTGVIYVVPSAALAATPVISQAEWVAYNQYIYLTPPTLSNAQKQVILQVGEAISKGEYTAAQQSYAIIAFLSALQSAFPDSTPLKFVLDERTWFIDNIGSNGEPIPMILSKVFSYEQAYSDDVSGIIQTAEQQGLDGWLSGVRLSEYASKDWNLMGPVMVDLVTEINAHTSGWLTNHLFIGAGGGWGQDWKGINAMQCPAGSGWQFPPCTGAFPFFQYMAAQVGNFAFGDKFMELNTPQEYMLNGNASGMTYDSMTAEIADFCTENTRRYHCDKITKPSTKDWQAFLEDDVDGEGFSDLIDLLNANAQQYPHLANVIFEGDDSDSLATMTGASVNATAALSGLFSNAMQGRYEDAETGIGTGGEVLGTWTGKIFLDGFDDLTTVPRPAFYGDAGYSMFDTNYNDFMFASGGFVVIPRPKTTAVWSTWP